MTKQPGCAASIKRRAVLICAASVLLWSSGSLAAALAAPPENQDQERQLGQSLYQDLEAKGQIVDHSPYYAVLRAIGERISKAAAPHWFTMNFIIITGNQPNAFSAPGGNVYVTEGLLRSVDNQDELANVIGHETGHLVLGHIWDRLTQAQHVSVFKNITNVFAHNQGSQNTVNAANAVASYSFLNFTRQQEYAADQEGLKLAAKAGFNPWGTVWFFQTMETMYGDAGFEQYVQQHPSTKDRIARVQATIDGDRRTYGKWSAKLSDTSGLPLDRSNDALVLH